MELSSPPTYWIGFCTDGSNGSSSGNTLSAGLVDDCAVGTVEDLPDGVGTVPGYDGEVAVPKPSGRSQTVTLMPSS